MALLDGLAQRVSNRALEMADDARHGIEQAFAQSPDVRLRREGDTLIFEAMGLLRRWVNDAQLRFAFWSRR